MCPGAKSGSPRAVRKLREEVGHCEVCCNISDTHVARHAPVQGGTHPGLWWWRTSATWWPSKHHQYKGLYHVLGRGDDPMDGIGPDELNVGELLARVDQGGVREVVLALGATLEGDTTSFFLDLQTEGTRRGRDHDGPRHRRGGELEQVDEVTLGRSILDRKPYAQSVRR